MRVLLAIYQISSTERVIQSLQMIGVRLSMFGIERALINSVRLKFK